MSITATDFATACRNLHRDWQHLAVGTAWTDVKVLEAYNHTYLRITATPTQSQSQPFNTTKTIHGNSDNESEAELHEEDPETLPPSPHAPHIDLSITYDVTHSPTYQVPILYINPTTTSLSSTHLSQSEIYSLLIPHLHEPHLQQTGPTGAISMTDHPHLGTPAYFIHPCRTAEAMETVCAGREVDGTEYLMLWLGIMGASVGLNVPVELAETMSVARSARV